MLWLLAEIAAVGTVIAVAAIYLGGREPTAGELRHYEDTE